MIKSSTIFLLLFAVVCCNAQNAQTDLTTSRAIWDSQFTTNVEVDNGYYGFIYSRKCRNKDFCGLPSVIGPNLLIVEEGTKIRNFTDEFLDPYDNVQTLIDNGYVQTIPDLFDDIQAA